MRDVLAEEMEDLSGERMIPGRSPGSTELQHWRRYRYFARLSKGFVLDVASGEGYGIAYLSRFSEQALGVDLEKSAVETAQNKYGKPQLLFVQGNALDLPVKNGSVSRFFSFETLEHLPDAARFLKEVKRALAPDGIFIVSTPNRLVLSPVWRNPPTSFIKRSGSDGNLKI